MHQLPAMFPGARLCKIMQASVDSILAPLGIRRRVISRGTRFLNIDAWTGIHFVGHLFDHFAKSPTKIPDREELRCILEKTNSVKENDPRIVVAAMPKDPSPQMVLAIVGGGYHEAWHTKYTKRTIVTIAEAHAMLDEAREVLRVGGVFDAKLRGFVATLHHLIEDVRIERRGNEDFPGAFQAMCDLQDFILDLEEQGRAEGSIIRGVDVSMNARSILLSCFRDLGLGYDTDRAREALEFYKKASPRAVALLAPGGLLEPMLREAQGLSRDDAMGSLRLAFQTAALLCRASRQKTSEPPLACSSCGASAKNLIVRAVRDAEGRKLRGRAEIECRICGVKSETQLPDNSLDLLQEESEQDERPEVDDLNADDVGEGFDGFGYDAHERRRGAKREEGLAADVLLVLGGSTTSEETSDPVVAIALDVVGGEGGDGLLNHASALQLIVGLLHQQEERQLLDGEMSWCPADPSSDVAEVVTSANRNLNTETTSAMLREVSREVSYMRAKFRTTFRAQEMTDISHGERRGRRLSERMLVDAKIDLLSGEMPARPYVGHSEQIETSLALAVCLDQSGSMSGLREKMQKCCLLLTDPVDKVGGATFAFGFRDNMQIGYFSSGEEGQTFHRTHAVYYDIFKRWDERLDGAKWRFANTRAEGSTPMADGVQFGLSALNERGEAHRFLVVLTDGQPNSPHEKVIRRQLRIAEEAGIHVIGVGVGREARYVTRLFPTSAWAETVSELPPILIAKLHEMCDFSGRRRGRRAQLDGPVSRMAK